MIKNSVHSLQNATIGLLVKKVEEVVNNEETVNEQSNQFIETALDWIHNGKQMVGKQES